MDTYGDSAYTLLPCLVVYAQVDICGDVIAYHIYIYTETTMYLVMYTNLAIDLGSTYTGP